MVTEEPLPDKDALYRQRHPDRVKASRAAYYAANRIAINEKRRARYLENREELSAKAAADRVQCPLCQGITFGRLYLPKHLQTRHCLGADEISALTKP